MRVAVALGSNLGDREAAIRSAVERLRLVLSDVQVSTRHETVYEGRLEDPQPAYLNAALVGRTILPADELLVALQDVEQQLGRARPYQDAPRTIDIDLILYGQAVIDTPRLVVPHPRFRSRRFVLAPLAEIAPEWVDPITHRRVDELLAALPRRD